MSRLTSSGRWIGLWPFLAGAGLGAVATARLERAGELSDRLFARDLQALLAVAAFGAVALALVLYVVGVAVGGLTGPRTAARLLVPALLSWWAGVALCGWLAVLALWLPVSWGEIP